MTEKKHRYSISQVTQGRHKFYTCTIPSDVLARCCFVTTRDDDPVKGFQRVLDKKRAQEIAKYIDSGLGTIPSAIILSAQDEADLRIIGKGKTVEFNDTPKAFLILDGQHRVYGFSIAESSLRIPVVIYNELTRRDESRLFIDINSKQRGVPNELLLDIKKLAEYENDEENLLREVFDLFNNDADSVFLNKFSAASRAKKKITRVTFNNSIKPLFGLFREKDAEEIYSILNSYFSAMKSGFEEIGCEDTLLGSVVFRAVSSFFPISASKLKDKYGADYTVDNFYAVMEGMFSRIKPAKLNNPGTSYKAISDYLENNIKSEFTL
ncbi:DGQHR domain-containing protein [Ketobacter sp. MCCC 1A13808]|uniref:DGQHR domain-containing protein n=1 Tax=Ketobacter sp. MCCC 1A13808 TaxID=2602738 RepID=UPI0012EB5E44|nr:DGQHR domain-containing protein [Ketobacter sp. MCCC 1A13808]MVF12292.1 DGQHR domain-containing protein [Ketobacter sp. MCCC 1A13808]